MGREISLRGIQLTENKLGSTRPFATRFKGISLPPKGWVLALLLIVYIFTGMIGHDPWKSDDAISIALAYGIVADANWLVLHLAGQLYPEAPLYHWVGAVTGHLFGKLLPLHDAIRLASGLFTLLTLEFILLASRELYGKSHAAAAPLILAGSVGFLFHAHEAQPMLAALSAHAAAYWALAMLARRPLLSAGVFGCALVVAFLSSGLIPLITLLPMPFFALYLSTSPYKSALSLFSSVILGLLVCLGWLLVLHAVSPDYVQGFVTREVEGLTQVIKPLTNAWRYFTMLLWYAWPAIPLAAWFLWVKRCAIIRSRLALPLLAFLSVFAILSVFVEAHSVALLLLLPPLVLLAAPCVDSLRRGASNALDWFGMITFSFLALLVWVGWSALVLGWPQRLAQQAVRLEPGFVGQFHFLDVTASLAITVVWFWLMTTSPRSPLRWVMHWMSGLTLFWVLIALLWMPWIDYGKTYRPLSASLSKTLLSHDSCVANANLSGSVLGSLDYFNRIRLTPLKSEESSECDWLLIHGDAPDKVDITAAGWRKVWEGSRPSDQRDKGKFHLYRREAKKKNPAPLPDILVDNPDKGSFRP